MVYNTFSPRTGVRVCRHPHLLISPRVPDRYHDTNYTPKIEFWHLLPVHLGEIGKGGSVRTPEGPRNPRVRHLESIWRKVRLVLQNVFSVANRPCSTLAGVVTHQLAFSRGRFWLLQELTTWLQTTECRPGVSPRVQSSNL